jgi:phosphoglucomutase
VTASHNPKEYNGYKVYWDDGGQVLAPHDEDIIKEVEKIQSIKEVRFEGNPALIHALGQEIDEAYLSCIASLSLNPEINSKYHDLKIVYTPIHGSGVTLVPAILKRYGFTNLMNVPEQDIPDGNFPTVVSPNPEEKAALNLAIEKAIATDSELVMASDPDADRVGIAIRNRDGSFKLLNGNQTGSLLIYYLLKNWSEKGKLKGNEFIARTVVTTPLFEDIANEYGVKTYVVLTGFKYIADLIRNKEAKEVFIGGGEESYGFMVGSFVRDKDAISSCAMIAEVAAWAKDQGMTLLDLLESIAVKYGLYKEHLISIVRKGQSGVAQINAMMEKFRSEPPKSLGGSDVVTILDFSSSESEDMLTGQKVKIDLPKSNVLQFVTADGSIISARPSGTEPKIKFYFSVKTKVNKQSELVQAESILDSKIKALIADMKLDQ